MTVIHIIVCLTLMLGSIVTFAATFVVGDQSWNPHRKSQMLFVAIFLAVWADLVLKL